MMARSMHDRRKGFTLIELLVVIAIISVLAMLSLPMLRKMYRGQSAWTAQEVLQGAVNGARADAVSYSTHTFFALTRPRWRKLQRQDQWVALMTRLYLDDNGNPDKAVLINRGTILPVDVGLEAKLFRSSGSISIPATIDYTKSSVVSPTKLVLSKNLHLTAPGYVLCVLMPPEDWTSVWPTDDYYEDHYVCLIHYNDLSVSGGQQTLLDWESVERTGVVAPIGAKLTKPDWLLAIQQGGATLCWPVAFGPDGTLDYLDSSVQLIRISLFYKAKSAADADDVNVLGIWPLTGEVRYIKPPPSSL